MKKLWLALFLICLGFAPARAQQSTIVPATMFSAPVVGGVTAGTLLITGQAGKSIYITALDLVPVATSVVQLIQGTGATCGTGSSAALGTMTFSAGQTLNMGSGNGAIIALASGNSLCIIITTAAAPGSIAWAIF